MAMMYDSRYIPMSEILFTKNPPMLSQGMRRFRKLSMRINLIDDKLCILDSSHDNDRFVYRSDVNYFEHGSGLRGQMVRFGFKDSDMGEEVHLIKAGHDQDIDRIMDYRKQELLFTALELKLIQARYKAYLKKIE